MVLFMTTTEGFRTDQGALLQTVLDDLADLLSSIKPEMLDRPTPCPQYTVADLRTHVLGWLTFFGAAATDPEGRTTRHDPSKYVAPADPAAAAEVVRAAAAELDAAIAAGLTERTVQMTQAAMPGAAALGMILWEYQVHGWDLARGTGLAWSPPAAATQASFEFAPTMLTDEWRGADFGPQVAVPDNAPVLDRLLGFSGRDPNWAPPRSD